MANILRFARQASQVIWQSDFKRGKCKFNDFPLLQITRSFDGFNMKGTEKEKKCIACLYLSTTQSITPSKKRYDMEIGKIPDNLLRIFWNLPVCNSRGSNNTEDVESF